MQEPTSWGDARRPRPTHMWQPATDAPPPQARPKLSIARLFAVFVVFGLFGACGVAVVAAGSHSSSATSARVKEMTAFDMCKQSVRDHLKAPSTAKFRDYFGDQAPTIIGSGDGPYSVVSTVDSQNGFGAMIRSSFSCTATYVGGDQWNVHSTVG